MKPNDRKPRVQPSEKSADIPAVRGPKRKPSESAEEKDERQNVERVERDDHVSR